MRLGQELAVAGIVDRPGHAEPDRGLAEVAVAKAAGLGRGPGGIDDRGHGDRGTEAQIGRSAGALADQAASAVADPGPAMGPPAVNSNKQGVSHLTGGAPRFIAKIIMPV